MTRRPTTRRPTARWLVTGAGGMLGHDLVAVLDRSGCRVTAADRATLDITDPGSVAGAVAGHDIVVNAAGRTDVDGAEADEGPATGVNGHAVAGLARACAASGAVLVQISTDYVFGGAVFDGTARTPYPETAPTSPVNAYGRGKLVGEQAVLTILPRTGYVVRTAWLYGAHGGGFVATVLRLAAEQPTLDVVDDQYGQPTWTRALAEQVVALGAGAVRGAAPAGVYHGTASGQTSWFGLARAVYAGTGLDPDRIRPTTSAAFRRSSRAGSRSRPRPAPRPAYSVLGHDRWAAAGVPVQPPWQAQLTEALRAGLTTIRPPVV